MTALVGNVNAVETVWTLDSMIESDLVQVGNEVVEITARFYARVLQWNGEAVPDQIRIRRGTNGTSAASHDAGAALTAANAFSGGGGLSVTDGTTTVAATSVQVPAVTDAGAGLAVVQPVVISDSDPGAIGAGNLWLNTTQDAFDDLTNFPLLVRNLADDGWIPVMGDSVGSVVISAWKADGTKSAGLNLGSTTPTANVGIAGEAGASNISFADIAGAASVEIRVGGNIMFAANDEGVSFNAVALVTRPVVPLTTPSLQQVIDALVATGLIAQSD